MFLLLDSTLGGETSYSSSDLSSSLKHRRQQDENNEN